MSFLMRYSLFNWLEDRNRGYCLLLIGAVLALYLPFLSNPFFFDDLTFFGAASGTYDARTAFLTPRGVPYNTLLWTMHWFGSDLPHAYRLVDAVLHAATAIALFALSRNLLRTLLPQCPADRAQLGMIDFAAAFAALVFAMHPVASYAAGYVVQRSIVMATLFSLLCLLFYLYALVSGRKRWLALSVVAYFLAAFAKEHAVGIPMLITAITVLMRDQVWQRRRELLPALLMTAIAMAAVAVLLVLRIRGVIGTAYEPMASHMFEQAGLPVGQSPVHALSMVTQAGLYFKYLWLWLLPVPGWMSVDMREPFILSWTHWMAWAGPIGFVLVGVWSARLMLRGGWLAIAGLGLLYPWLMFLVEFSSIRVQETFVLYRSYLWMPGLMLVLAALMFQLQRRLAGQQEHLPGLRVVLLLLALAVLTPATLNRLQVAADPWRLWNDAAKMLANDAVPGADRILYNRGNAALAAGRPAEAVSDLDRVVQISPKLYQVHYALGLAHYANKDSAKAEVSFRQGLIIKADNPALLYAHAVTLRQLGRFEESRAAMSAACAAQSQPACFIAARMQAAKNTVTH